MRKDLERFDDTAGTSAGEDLSDDCFVLVGAYTNYNVLAHNPHGTEADGIHTFRLNPKRAELTPLGSAVEEANPNPAFMKWCPESQRMYIVNERIDENGKLFCFGLSPEGNLDLKGEVDAAGKSTCYVYKDMSGKWALTINYWDATLSVVELNEDGSLGRVTDVHRRPGYDYCEQNSPDRAEHLQRRQGWSHLHCVVPEPDGLVYFVPDLGENCIHQFTLDRENGKLGYEGNVTLQPGHGPRHLVFHPKDPVAYVVNELDSTVDVLELVPAGTAGNSVPMVRVTQTISTTPRGLKGKSHCAEIKVGPTGNFLYVANRFSDTIAVFAIDRRSGGSLSLLSIQSSLGCTPRHFSFDPTGKVMVVANTDNDSLVLFYVDERSGLLTYSGKTYNVRSPNYVQVVKRSDLVA